jgi:hypothetical protein
MSNAIPTTAYYICFSIAVSIVFGSCGLLQADNAAATDASVELLERIFDTNRYDRRVRPDNGGAHHPQQQAHRIGMQISPAKANSGMHNACLTNATLSPAKNQT